MGVDSVVDARLRLLRLDGAGSSAAGGSGLDSSGYGHFRLRVRLEAISDDKSGVSSGLSVPGAGARPAGSRDGFCDSGAALSLSLASRSRALLQRDDLQ